MCFSVKYATYTASHVGDAVIVQPRIITIDITENDDPYGVFLFTVTSLNLMEGDEGNQLG